MGKNSKKAGQGQLLFGILKGRRPQRRQKISRTREKVPSYRKEGGWTCPGKQLTPHGGVQLLEKKKKLKIWGGEWPGDNGMRPALHRTKAPVGCEGKEKVKKKKRLRDPPPHPPPPPQPRPQHQPTLVTKNGEVIRGGLPIVVLKLRPG